MLTGQELLDRVNELGDASKSDLVRACGYCSTHEDGSERLKFTAFYEALLDAKGINHELETSATKVRQAIRGQSPRMILSIQMNLKTLRLVFQRQLVNFRPVSIGLETCLVY